MKSKRTFGILLCIVGIALILFSMYIKGETDAGRKKISSAQKQVDTGKKLFSLNPVSEQVGKGLTGTVQRRIDRGREEVVQYEDLAFWFQVGGAVLIVIGIGVIWTGRKKY